jgi:lipopolysaccharide transport system ATP-binding protein
MTNIAISVQNISKCYQIYENPRDRLKQLVLPRMQRFTCKEPKQYYREFWALKDISFEIKKGETIGIIGRNGSGKSTLLQIICGTVDPTNGSVSSNGRVTALLELGSGFNPEFTGRENVYINASIYGLSLKEIHERYDEIVNFADIGDFIEQPVKVYSSGMLMRLAFSVSVCLKPDILIIDEALAVGDAAFQFKCLDRLARLTSQGVSILFVSHDMNMIKRLCNRVLYIGKDQICRNGTPEDMAEFYLLEMRQDQQRNVINSNATVSLKQHSSIEDGIAYGTHEGKIISAYFTDTNSSQSIFSFNQVIEIHVKANVSNDITNPNISFTIQDHKLIVIGGANFPLKCNPAVNGYKTTSITVKFNTILSAGNYHVTLKLMNGHIEETSNLIEKQLSMLSFEMLASSKYFLGAVDFGIEESL